MGQGFAPGTFTLSVGVASFVIRICASPEHMIIRSTRERVSVTYLKLCLVKRPQIQGVQVRNQKTHRIERGSFPVGLLDFLHFRHIHFESLAPYTGGKMRPDKPHRCRQLCSSVSFVLHGICKNTSTLSCHWICASHVARRAI